MIFAERKIYEDGTLTKKYWIAIDDENVREVDEETYGKLDCDQFEKLKNIGTSENKKITSNIDTGGFKDPPFSIGAISELVELVRLSDEKEAYEILSEFTDALCDEYVEVGYQQAMLDIERIAVTLKKNHKKIL